MAVTRRLGYSRKEAAMVLGVSLSLIDALIDREELPVLRISRDGESSQRPRVIVPVWSLENYIRKQLGWTAAEQREQMEAAGVEGYVQA